jgi:phage terminase Nu1 subunit (DNA packaging protein)
MPYATLDQIAHLLKLTPRMVNIHVKHNGMPRVDRGQYDVVKCVHWYLDYKDRLIGEARRGDESEQQARARLTKATADLRELELARERGELIPADTIKFLWERVVVSFKTKMLSIPTKLPQRLVACRDINQVKDLLEREIYEALNELSMADIDITGIRRLEKARPVDSSAGESSTKAHGKRVGREKSDTKPRVKRGTGSVENRQG